MADLIKFFCGKCKKLLCKGHITNGSIEIKCKCGMSNTFKFDRKPEKLKTTNQRPA